MKSPGCAWGSWGKLIKALHSGGAQAAVMCGALNKANVFRDMRFDFKALTLLGRLKQMSDDGLLRTICQVLEDEGYIHFAGPTPFCLICWRPGGA